MADKSARDGFGIMHQGSAPIDHGTDLMVIARSLDSVLADHVNHLLVAFDQGYVVSEDLAWGLARMWVNGGKCVLLRAMGYAVQVEDHCQSTASVHLDSRRLYFGAVSPFLEYRPLLRCDLKLYLECSNPRWRRIIFAVEEPRISRDPDRQHSA